MPFILPDKAYAFIKWLLAIVLPALGTFYGIVATELDLEDTESVLRILLAFGTLLGVILGVSAAGYNSSDAKYDGTIDPWNADKALEDEMLNVQDPYKAQNRKEILLKVEPPAEH